MDTTTDTYMDECARVHIVAMVYIQHGSYSALLQQNAHKCSTSEDTVYTHSVDPFKVPMINSLNSTSLKIPLKCGHSFKVYTRSFFSLQRVSTL